MMKKSIITLTLVSSLLFTASCKKKSDETSVTTNPNGVTIVDSQTSKAELETSMSTMSTEFSDMTSNSGFRAGSNLYTLFNNANISLRKKKSSTIFDDIKNFELEYNPELQDFDTVKTNASHLIIHFPSEEGATVNNATLNLYDLQFSDATEENLTELDLDILIDN